MKNFLILMGVAILATTSCQNSNEYSKEIQLLNSLKKDLGDLKLSLEDFDVEKLLMIDSTASEHAATLNAGIQDTLQKDEWMLLGNYIKAINKRLNKFDDRLRKLNNEVDTSLVKVDDLITDLNNNVWNREQAMKYIRAETAKAAELRATTERLKEKAALAMETYHDKHQSIDSLMIRIEERLQAATSE